MIVACFKKKPDTSRWFYYLFGRIIQAVTGKYIHAELRFPDGRCFSSRDNGPEWAVVDMPSDGWDFIQIPTSKEQEALMVHQADILISGAFTSSKVCYGWSKILTGFLPIPIMVQAPTELICSESCTIVIQCTGLMIGYSAAGISPTKMAKILTAELPKWIDFNSK